MVNERRIGTAARSASEERTSPLDVRELVLIGAMLQPQERVERFLRGQADDGAVLWVAVEDRLLLIEGDLRIREATEIPYALVSGVEVTAGSHGAAVRLEVPGRTHAVHDADQEMARLFASHVLARCMGEHPWSGATETRGWRRAKASR